MHIYSSVTPGSVCTLEVVFALLPYFVFSFYIVILAATVVVLVICLLLSILQKEKHLLLYPKGEKIRLYNRDPVI